MKTCCDCNKTMPFELFVPKASCKDGYEPRCRRCRSIKYNKGTPELLCKKLYLSQCTNSANRNHPAPDYTLKEFTEWVVSQPNFAALYSDWVASGYSKNLAPSADRLNDSLPYSLNNLQLITWEQNRNKAAKCKKEGQLISGHKPVSAFNADGTLYKTYSSINEALREFGGSKSAWAITSVANGVSVKDGRGKLYSPKTYKGFVWKWA